MVESNVTAYVGGTSSSASLSSSRGERGVEVLDPEAQVVEAPTRAGAVR